MSAQPRCPKCDEEPGSCRCDPLAGTRWAALRDSRPDEVDRDYCARTTTAYLTTLDQKDTQP